MATLQMISVCVTSLLLLMVRESHQLYDCPTGDVPEFVGGTTCQDLLAEYGPKGMCKSNGQYCCATCNEIERAGPDDLSGPLIAEGYFVIDKKALEKYVEEENGDVKRAKASMKKDVWFYITDANYYYETLKPYGLDIQLKVVAIQVIDDDVVEPGDVWGGNIVVGEKILERFDNFLRTDSRARKDNLYDFAILFTGYDLEDPVQGIADSGLMCLPYASGVVELDGLMGTSGTLAHEAGHIFGAEHDPDGSYYVMAPMQSNDKHPDVYKFSELSADYIRTTLEVHGASDCLRKTKASSRSPKVTPQKYNGRMQDPSTYCSRAKGAGSTMCLSEHFYKGPVSNDNVCHMIMCRNPDNPNMCGGAFTPEGMVCATGKSCRKGKCVDDSRAKLSKVDDTCVFGDSVTATSEGMSCKEMIAQKGAGHCKHRSDECCQTCRKYETDIPNCKYGDDTFAGGVTCTSLYQSWGKGLCNDATNARVCCETCHKVKSGLPITG